MPWKKDQLLTCKQCGRLFRATIRDVELGRPYCSRNCRFIGQTGRPRSDRGSKNVTRKCPRCGKLFEVGGRDSNGKKLPHKSQEYCTTLCANRSKENRGQACNLMSGSDCRGIAQFFDGEGSTFAIENGRSKSLLLAVSIGNTDLEVLRNIARSTGLGKPVPRRSKKDGQSTVHIWRCFGFGAVSLLMQIFPYLEIKKPIALLIINAWEEMHADVRVRFDTRWRNELLLESKRLNRRGPVGARCRADIRALNPELRGELISNCGADRLPYEPKNVLGILASLNARQPGVVIETRPGWHLCPVCQTEVHGPRVTCSQKCAYRYRGRTSQPCLTIDDDLARGLAYLIAAEGCVRVRRSYDSVVSEVLFGNTDRTVVELFHAATGLGGVHLRAPRKATQAPSFHWKCQAQGAHGFLEQILPFLEVKNRQAHLAMYVQERRLHVASRSGDRSWQDEVLRLNTLLNAKGKKAAVPPTELGDGLIVI